MGRSQGDSFLRGWLLAAGFLVLALSGGCTGESLQEPPGGAGVSPVLSPRLRYANLHRLVEREPDVSAYLDLVRKAVRRHRRRHRVDPLLVLALIKHESGYDARSISRMGAAGPLQIMPSTARELGLEPVYESEERQQGLEWHRRAGRSLERAVHLMKRERFLPMRRHLDAWRRLRDRSRQALEAYRDRLREKVEGRSDRQLRTVDQRFVKALAVDRGVEYLARMLERRGGDVREGLAAYNAGPGSVRRYRGIPPYEETVRYQNRIINTYRRYRRWVTRDSDGSDIRAPRTARHERSG